MVARITAVMKSHGERLWSYPNVVGFGIGFKVKGGKKLDQLAIIVFVKKKVSKSGLRQHEIIPTKVDGELTDVQESGEIIACARTDKWRPAPPGISVGHPLVTAGTFGCVVLKGGIRKILSNNHVLANCNTASVGDAIYQPGVADGGGPSDTLALLEDWVPIVFSDVANNLVDAAIADPINDADILDEILEIGIPVNVVEPVLGMSVVKSGRTSAVTYGTITAVHATVSVSYGVSGTARFIDQIITDYMISPGDSGSLLLTYPDNEAIGLCFAASDVIGVASDIQYAESLLGISIVTGSSTDLYAKFEVGQGSTDLFAKLVVSGYEDFLNDWTKHGANIAATTTRSTLLPGFTRTTDDQYMYKDYGGGYWDGDWSIIFEVYIDVCALTPASYNRANLIAFCENELGDYVATRDDSEMAVAMVDGENDVHLKAQSRDGAGGGVSGTQIPIVLDTLYYCKFFRSGNNITLQVFSDQARTVQVGGDSTAAVGASDAYRYVMVPQSLDLVTGYTIYGYVQNLAMGLTVHTIDCDQIQDNQARGNGLIDSLGGVDAEERGFVYDTSSHGDPGNVSPAVSDYPSVVNETGSFSVGDFNLTIPSLTEDCIYYVRAYAHSSIGRYSYGDEVSFIAGKVEREDTTDADFDAGSHNDTRSKDDNLELSLDLSLLDTESFEVDYGDWLNAAGNKSDWRRNSGSTPSASTGPSSAYDGTWYIYVETSSGYSYSAGDTDIVEFDLVTENDGYVDFHYSQYGSEQGTLYLEGYNGSWHEIWKSVGDQGNQWNHVTSPDTDFSNYTKLRFRNVAAGGYQGDVALDLIKVYTGSGYLPSGIYTSAELDISALDSCNSSLISWDATLNGQTLSVYSRYSTNGGDAWSDWAACTSGTPMTGVGGIEGNIAGALIQYKVEMSGDTVSTPQLHDITMSCLYGVSVDLHAQFTVGQHAEDLRSEFHVKQWQEDLYARFNIPIPASVNLFAWIDVNQENDSQDIYTKFGVRQIYDLSDQGGIGFFWQGVGRGHVDIQILTPTGAWIGKFPDWGPWTWVVLLWEDLQEVDIDGSRPDKSEITGFLWTYHSAGVRHLDGLYGLPMGGDTDVKGFLVIRHATFNELPVGFEVQP